MSYVELVDTRNNKVVYDFYLTGEESAAEIEEMRQAALLYARGLLEEEAIDHYGYPSEKHYSEQTMDEVILEDGRERYIDTELKEFKFYSNMSIEL